VRRPRLKQLKQRAVPSLSLFGLVRHMAEVERSCFRRRIAGADMAFVFCDVETNPDGDFDNVDDADAQADVSTYHAEMDAAHVVVRDGRSTTRSFTRIGKST
jgi:hypothetical protein